MPLWLDQDDPGSHLIGRQETRNIRPTRKVRPMFCTGLKTALTPRLGGADANFVRSYDPAEVGLAKGALAGLARRVNSPPVRTRAPSGLRINLVEGLARIAERVNAGRHTAIHRNLQQDLLDFVPGEPVLQGALDVKL